MVVILYHQCIETDTDAQDVVALCDLARVHELGASRDDVSQHVDKLSQSAFVPPGQPPRCNLWNLRVRQPDVFAPRTCNM